MRKILYTALLLANTGYAQDAIRQQPFVRSASDRETAQYVTTGSPAYKWSGFVYWYYNPASQPPGLNTDAVIEAIKTAADRWTAMCSLHFVYLGKTTVAPYFGSASSAVDNRNVVGWSTNSNPNYPYDMNRWTNAFNNYTDVDIGLNTSRYWTIAAVDAAMTSAFGFAIGLKTSNVNASVMASDLTRDFYYDRTLRGDDAAGCASLYGASSSASSDRAFNWAETTYPQLLWPSPAVSGDYDGYYYRYYSGTKSYVATKNGSVFYMGPNGVIQNLGTLDSYKTQVQNAGF